MSSRRSHQHRSASASARRHRGGGSRRGGAHRHLGGSARRRLSGGVNGVNVGGSSRRMAGVWRTLARKQSAHLAAYQRQRRKASRRQLAASAASAAARLARWLASSAAASWLAAAAMAKIAAAVDGIGILWRKPRRISCGLYRRLAYRAQSAAKRIAINAAASSWLVGVSAALGASSAKTAPYRRRQRSISSAHLLASSASRQ